MSSAPQPTDNDDDRATAGAASPLASRRFFDDAGVLWLVQEVRDVHYDRRASRSLVFIGGDAMRRVRNYPEDWFGLPDADLLALSRGR